MRALLDCEAFYAEYHGHRLSDLAVVVSEVPEGRGVIYLLGDSTLDNKYWLHSVPMKPACNGYERILRPPASVSDMAFWINHELIEQGLDEALCAVNTSIEESTLGLRNHGRTLLPQDKFVREHVTEQDVLVVSCGGNDIALRPSGCTIASIIPLLASPMWMIDKGIAPGLGHFVRLFRDETKAFIESVTADRKPRVVCVCMLYYLDTVGRGGWADRVLGMLGYNRDPKKLQLVMRKIFELATCQIQIEGVDAVVPIPLYEALDGTQTDDYVDRVEPSSHGGHKLAKLIVSRLIPALAKAPVPSTVTPSSKPKPTGSTPEVAAMPSAVHSHSRTAAG